MAEAKESPTPPYYIGYCEQNCDKDGKVIPGTTNWYFGEEALSRYESHLKQRQFPEVIGEAIKSPNIKPLLDGEVPM